MAAGLENAQDLARHLRNDEKTLNALGAERWELATYAVWPVGMSSVDTCVFK